MLQGHFFISLGSRLVPHRAARKTHLSHIFNFSCNMIWPLHTTFLILLNIALACLILSFIPQCDWLLSLKLVPIYLYFFTFSIGTHVWSVLLLCLINFVFFFSLQSCRVCVSYTVSAISIVLSAYLMLLIALPLCFVAIII